MAGAPAVSPIPGAAQYAQADTLANNAYNNALANINKNRLNTLTQYGYTGTIDPHTGVLTNMHVDPHSMYGSLQQLLHGSAVEDQSADWGAQSRGLVGGLAHQAHSLAHYQHGADLTGLGEQLTGNLSDLQDQQQQASEARDAALWQAEQDQLNANLQQQQQDSLDQLLNPGGNYPDSGGSGSSGGSGGGGVYTGPGAAAKARALRKVANRKRRGGGGGRTFLYE